MSAPTKAAAYRAGYLRALRDVEARADLTRDALLLAIDVAGADRKRTADACDVLHRSTRETVWALRREIAK